MQKFWKQEIHNFEITISELRFLGSQNVQRIRDTKVVVQDWLNGLSGSSSEKIIGRLVS